MSETKKLRVFRQGDLIFRELDSVPASVKRHLQPGKLHIEGETAGHAHEMNDLKIANAESWNAESELGLRSGTQAQVVVLDEPRQLEHPQHEPIEVPKGVYATYRVRDWANRMGD